MLARIPNLYTHLGTVRHVCLHKCPDTPSTLASKAGPACAVLFVHPHIPIHQTPHTTHPYNCPACAILFVHPHPHQTPHTTHPYSCPACARLLCVIGRSTPAHRGHWKKCIKYAPTSTRAHSHTFTHTFTHTHSHTHTHTHTHTHSHTSTHLRYNWPSRHMTCWKCMPLIWSERLRTLRLTFAWSPQTMEALVTETYMVRWLWWYG